jgi:RNA polymerase sigma factor (sigma-70 family)
VLDDAGRALVVEYDTVATGAAWHFFQKAPRADFEELRGIARLALAEAVERYPRYCAARGYDPDSGYIIAYLSQRVHGAILDWARSNDWLTRAQRQKYKLLEAAELELPPGASLAELARVAGLTEAEARDVRAAGETRPLRLDEAAENGTGGPGSIRDPFADVEPIASVHAILGAYASALGALPRELQILLVLRYVHGLDLAPIGGVLGINRNQAAELYDAAVITLHDAMLAEASEGCACGRRNGSCACSA